jgi:hydrogenase nickel incorporation protein HypA/HybF
MHELAIAEAMVRIAEETAAGRRVTAVELKVGALRQVVPSALEFSFGLVAQGTVVEGAELEIEQVPVAVECRRCGETTRPDGFPLACVACGGVDVAVVAGEELLVEWLELDDELETLETVAGAAKGGTAYVE